jgi:hypothetical protein
MATAKGFDVDDGCVGLRRRPGELVSLPCFAAPTGGVSLPRTSNASTSEFHDRRGTALALRPRGAPVRCRKESGNTEGGDGGSRGPTAPSWHFFLRTSTSAQQLTP